MLKRVLLSVSFVATLAIASLAMNSQASARHDHHGCGSRGVYYSAYPGYASYYGYAPRINYYPGSYPVYYGTPYWGHHHHHHHGHHDSGIHVSFGF
ncbi:MAG: hypothetical protein IT425_09315 [Pirellulales bacterium]|nr:hypothetical protein [Pirellulales bacterium]